MVAVVAPLLESEQSRAEQKTLGSNSHADLRQARADCSTKQTATKTDYCAKSSRHHQDSSVNRRTGENRRARLIRGELVNFGSLSVGAGSSTFAYDSLASRAHFYPLTKTRQSSAGCSPKQLDEFTHETIKVERCSCETD